MKNVERKVDYTQVCIWPGTLVDKPEELESFMLEHFNTRIQFLETIITLPDQNDPTSGGRHDVFFAVYQDDIGKFAIPRLKMGIRWIEDVLSSVNNYHFNPIYPPRVFAYQSWNPNEDDMDEGDDN